MAITDNTFTPEELTAAVAANPALKDHLVGAVKTAGYVARTAQEEESFIGEKTKSLYDGLDKDIFDTSGIAKLPTEKTYDYAKRTIGSLKTSIMEATTPLQTKIADLEKAIADGNGNETMKAQLEALQKREETYQSDIKDRDAKLFEKDVMLDLRDGLRGIKLNEALPAGLRKLAVDNATACIVAMARPQKNADQTETVVYLGADGKVALNKENQSATAADLLAELLTEVIDAGHGGAGGGAGSAGGSGGAGGAGGGRKAVPTSLPATVKTQGQLIDYLKEFSVTDGTDDYDKAWDALGGDKLPLR
ncbi:hypothetical protein [Hymenobacter algoricola]|uniref:Uncharacterized protein n=1 Tax=Hymenobacter algoricola TaxID=486267 RepID=A0ABP7NBG3_9BACT